MTNLKFLLFLFGFSLAISSCDKDEKIQNPNRLNIGESKTLIIDSELKWNETSIHVEAGEIYTIVSTGTWTDSTTISNANGYSDPFLDLFSNFKRNINAEWFELVVELDSTATAPKYVVGADTTITFNESGTLWFYANDAIGFYGNNSGSINTEITRE